MNINRSTLFVVMLALFLITSSAMGIENKLLKLARQNKQLLKSDGFQCVNITHFDYQSHISLGKNDEANRTFTQILPRITLKQITYKFNDSTTYRLFNAVPSFYYRDSKQKADIVGNNSILIDGGFLEATIDFQWTRIGSQPSSGKATVFGLSDEVIFAKDIIIDPQGFFRYELYDYINITFFNDMNLTRYSPPDMSDENKKNILKMVNTLMNSTTLRHQLQDQIDRIYSFILKANIHEEKMPIDKFFDYNWTNPWSKNNVIIQFVRNPLLIDIEKDGIHYGYQALVKDWSDSKCGIEPPRNPLNPKAYGGSQELISFTFYQNVLAYAISQGVLNTTLNREYWQSRMFQFYAGDLYEVLPEIAKTELAATEVNGACTANTQNLLVFKSDPKKFGDDTFNVTFHSKCSLSIKAKKIIDFDVGLELTIKGVPSANHVDYVLHSHTEFVSFYDAAPYKLQNELLAREMVSRSINRLYQQKLFGSGWPLNPERDYPSFQVEHDYTVVYDTTHV